MIKLVLLRHGQSTWNRENRFTGWTDVPLTNQGINEAKKAGRTFKEKKIVFDVAFTNMHKRAINTTSIVLNELKLKIPVYKAWQLNERHYGALQGLNKSEMAAKYGEEQVHVWRRSYDVRPPALTKNDRRWPGNDAMYKSIDKKFLPLAESLKDTIKRVTPYWKKEISPLLKKGRKVLVSASGNSLRALVKIIDNVSEKDIVSFNIPTGIPLVYELDSKLRPIRHYFLGNPKEIRKAIQVVEQQGKAKK
ncbi:2,3-diphosphoglycerate-dependent phosphoglycerate mutase [Candidatus Woesearchaeota archaeon]|nr:2,3-diphosphoglycerate-dependent phosphoglycerate mutase [Candidatus Woesearchaeota archaeon]